MSFCKTEWPFSHRSLPRQVHVILAPRELVLPSTESLEHLGTHILGTDKPMTRYSLRILEYSSTFSPPFTFTTRGARACHNFYSTITFSQFLQQEKVKTLTVTASHLYRAGESEIIQSDCSDDTKKNNAQFQYKDVIRDKAGYFIYQMNNPPRSYHNSQHIHVENMCIQFHLKKKSTGYKLPIH